MDRMMVGWEYASHLTDADLEVLASVADAPGGDGRWSGGSGPADASSLRRDPAALLRLLEHPAMFRAVLGQGGAVPGRGGAMLAHGGAVLGRAGTAPGPAVTASPFLVFAVFVQRATTELASMDYVPERMGRSQRVPLFDAPALRDFLAAPARRLFLAELLASFTRVASGRYRVRAGGRTITRRFSELDPARLAGLLDATPQAERPGVYRRLGDVTLFLTGVFPDYAAAHAVGPVNAARLLRAAQLPASQHEHLASTPAIELLEHLGARWYRAACDLAPVVTARLAVTGEVADRFRPARRVLNHLTDRYLFPAGNPWFPQPG